MKKINRADQILDAAQSLFEEHGYQKTVLRDVSGKSDVGVGLISYHYGGKYQLAVQCILRYFDEISQRIKFFVSQEENPVLYTAVFFRYSNLFFLSGKCRTFYIECLEEGIFATATEESTLKTAKLIKNSHDLDISDSLLFLYAHTIPLNIERTLVLGKEAGKFEDIPYEDIPTIAFQNMLIHFTKDTDYIQNIIEESKHICYKMLFQNS